MSPTQNRFPSIPRTVFDSKFGVPASTEAPALGVEPASEVEERRVATRISLEHTTISRCLHGDDHRCLARSP
jgi:hypothetical protein